MRFTKSLALLASIAFADAQFTKPLAGDYFNIGEKFAIEWDTAGLQGPINIDLVPSGVTDGSVVAERIGGKVIVKDGLGVWYTNKSDRANPECWSVVLGTRCLHRGL